MNLFENYPENFKYGFKKECLYINYSRVFYLSRILIVMALGMFFMSVLIKDSLSIQIANRGLFLGLLVSILSMFGKKPENLLGYMKFKQFMIDSFYVLALAWGIVMVGYNPKNPVVFFDITIVCILVSVFYITIYQKLAVYFFVAYTFLIFGTPYLKYSDYYPPLVVAPILFMIICFYVSRILYRQVMEKFVMGEALRERQEELVQQLDVTNEELELTGRNISRDIIRTLIKVLEYYDGYTKGHSENVANYAKKIGEQLGMTLEQVEELYVCGLVHDIGKILIPIHILNKPDRLTKEEYEIISKHSQFGYEMLNESKHLSRIATIVLHHHEHWDGKGYPSEFKHDAIPIESQILMVADTWDAMLSERVYRHSKTVKEAKEELLRYRGSQFSPTVVDAMLVIVES